MNPKQVAEDATELLTNQHGCGEGVRETILGAFEGTPENWPNYVPSRLADNDVTNLSHLQGWFNRQGTPAVAVAKMATVAVDGWGGEQMGAWSEQQIYDFAAAVVRRYVVGRIGEVYWAAVVAERGETIAPERDDDETRGIDIRTERGETFQVKTTSQLGNENFGNHEADYEVTVVVDGGEVKDVRVE